MRLLRWMLFVGGENLSIEGEKYFVEKQIEPPAAKLFLPGVYLWLPHSLGVERRVSFGVSRPEMERHAIRAYYFTSVVGSPEVQENVRTALWELGFNPRVFQRKKGGGKSKGVDIALATEMLSNAARDNYDIALLMAGDGDYAPRGRSEATWKSRLPLVVRDARPESRTPDRL